MYIKGVLTWTFCQQQQLPGNRQRQPGASLWIRVFIFHLEPDSAVVCSAAGARGLTAVRLAFRLRSFRRWRRTRRNCAVPAPNAHHEPAPRRTRLGMLGARAGGRRAAHKARSKMARDQVAGGIQAAPPEVVVLSPRRPGRCGRRRRRRMTLRHPTRTC